MASGFDGGVFDPLGRMMAWSETFRELFAAPQRGDLAYNGHYKVFGDLSEATNLEVGLSYGQGPNGLLPNSKTRLEGIDATLRWKPLRTATYRSASFRGEFIRSRREEPLGDQTADGVGHPPLRAGCGPALQKSLTESGTRIALPIMNDRSHPGLQIQPRSR
jgi:hypothetical protein